MFILKLQAYLCKTTGSEQRRSQWSCFPGRRSKRFSLRPVGNIQHCIERRL